MGIWGWIVTIVGGVAWTMIVTTMIWGRDCLCSFTFQPPLTFASKGSSSHHEWFHPPATNDGRVVSRMDPTRSKGSKGLVVYCHGNAMNASQAPLALEHRKYFETWPLADYTWVCLEYEGYGNGQQKKPDFTTYYTPVVDYLRSLVHSQHEYTNVVLIGESLGTHALTRALVQLVVDEGQSKLPSFELVLVNPFRSFRAIAEDTMGMPSWVVSSIMECVGLQDDDMSVERNLFLLYAHGADKFTSRTTIICSEKDELFPPHQHGHKLFQGVVFGNRKGYYTLTNATHNDYQL